MEARHALLLAAGVPPSVRERVKAVRRDGEGGGGRVPQQQATQAQKTKDINDRQAV